MAYEAAMHGDGEALRKGPWLQEEDDQLTTFGTCLGERRWDSLAKVARLRRSGKSCRSRWLNYLRPNLKHGPFSVEEEQLILQLQQRWGNKWSKIAHRLPGRTDNEIKNYWRIRLRKKSQIQHQENSVQDAFCQKSTDMVSEDHSHMNLDSQENFQSDYSEILMEREHESNSTGSYEYYGSAGFVEDCDTWDYSGSLWDMN